jgi:prephenate dehydrogenase
VLAYGVSVRWGKITIIGIGLLGGSIGLALRKRNLAREVHGFARRKATVQLALKSGVVSRAGSDLHQAVQGADLVILCIPVSQMEAVTAELLPSLKRGAIVTDVGSVKAAVVRRLSPVVRKAGGYFVGSHPMAGSEKSGVRAARADLFHNTVCVITPTVGGSKSSLRKVAGFWTALGSQVLTLNPALHDKLVSRASHLPHLVASALASQVLDPRQDERQAQLCASGFRDTTRVACGSPALWRDIAMANRTNLSRDLAQFEKNLRRLREKLSMGDAAGIEALLQTAAGRREAWKEPEGKACSAE